MAVSRFQFSPDSSLLAFLRRDADGSSLNVIDVSTGVLATLVSGEVGSKLAVPKTLAAQLIRERRRWPAAGIVDFAWSPTSEWILLPLGQQVLRIEARRVLGSPGDAADSFWWASQVADVRSLAKPTVHTPSGWSVPPSVRVDFDVQPPSEGAEPINVQPSPCGRLVGMVIDREVYIGRSDGHGPLVQVTVGARESEGVMHGVSDFSHAEEFSRYEAWWWAPDGSALLVQRTDESAVSSVPIVQVAAEDPTAKDVVDLQRFPLTGSSNPTYSLAVIQIADVVKMLLEEDPSSDSPVTPRPVMALPWFGRTRWLSLGDARGRTDAEPQRLIDQSQPPPTPPDVYIARAGFCPDSTVWVQIVHRHQRTLDMLRYCPRSGRCELLVREDYPEQQWVNVCDAFTWLPSDLAESLQRESRSEPSRMMFIWPSERSGNRHLYLYTVPLALSFDGELAIERARVTARSADPSAVGAEDDQGIPTGPGDPRRVVLQEAASPEASLRRAITGGEWVVDLHEDGIGADGTGLALDPVSKSVFFLANAGSPLEKHLYRAPILSKSGLRSSMRLSASPSGLASPTSPSARSPGAKSRAGALVTLGKVGTDLITWGLSLPTYGIAQVTPGERGRFSAVVSPNGHFAVLVESSLTRGLGRPQARLVKLLDAHESDEAPSLDDVATPVETEAENTCVAARDIPLPALSSPADWGGSTVDVSPSGIESRRLTCHLASGPAPPAEGAEGVEFFACPAADGVTTLFGALLLPEGRESLTSGPPMPAALYVYGGPHVQMVRDDARLLGGATTAALRKAGIAVFVVDGRGSTDRGLVFETALKFRFGLTEVADQIAATHFLISSKIIDPSRLGVFGWSYGGFMTLMLLAKSAAAAPVESPPELRRSESGSLVTDSVSFRAGVAGAPVTFWEGYDSAYTERYMGRPSDHPDEYRRASVLEHASRLKGKHLLLIHGVLDENVHFRHSGRLMNQLMDANIDIDTLVLPRSRHGPSTPGDGAAVVRRMSAHLLEHLK
jgi:predicted esterase